MGEKHFSHRKLQVQITFDGMYPKFKDQHRGPCARAKRGRKRKVVGNEIREEMGIILWRL